ncbi:hypothetical protein EB796_009401 [Bugula neritina]|uniref:Uncharacterized protein n=1 Tax=Bugula neritina TaxID=10212 RepID=A0A7J7K0Y3_BUGNE|nr:hypothetical protein EB796_009401 [Bugula neritina]
MYLIAVNICEHAMCPRCPCSMYPYIYREANCNPLIHRLYMCNSAGNCHANEDIYSAVNRVLNQCNPF